MDRRRILTLVRAGSIVLVVAAIVAQAIVLADAGAFDPTRFFAFFTILSNLIGVAAFAWLLVRGDRPRSRGLELLRGAAVVYLTVTFFVVIFLLSGVDVQLQLVWVDVVLHKIFPIIVVARLDPGPADDPADVPRRSAVARLSARLDRRHPGPRRARWLVPVSVPRPGQRRLRPGRVTVVAITAGFLVVSGITLALGNRKA